MRIAVPAEGKNVSAHFGHCPHFLLFDVEGKEIVQTRILENPGHKPGFLPGFLAQQGVNCIIAGGMGAKAVELFDSEGIEVLTGASGDVEAVVKLYLEGKLVSSGSVCREHMHAGECGEH